MDEKTVTFVMTETVSTVRNITRYGWVLESEALVARWTLKIQLRRNLAVPIDFERYYLAEQKVIDLYHFREGLVWRYNVIAKGLQDTIFMPPNLPRRIRLEAEGWGTCFQYVRGE